jgi:hypothetical protein
MPPYLKGGEAAASARWRRCGVGILCGRGDAGDGATAGVAAAQRIRGGGVGGAWRTLSTSGWGSAERDEAPPVSGRPVSLTRPPAASACEARRARALLSSGSIQLAGVACGNELESPCLPRPG